MVRYEDWDEEEMPIKNVFCIVDSQGFESDDSSAYLHMRRVMRESFSLRLAKKRNLFPI